MSGLNFKLVLEIKKKDTNEHICHKIDGQRFGHTNTVKLNVNTLYDVKMTLRPAIQLQYFGCQCSIVEILPREGSKIGGYALKLNLIIQGDRHDMEVLGGQDSEDKRTYVTRYHTQGHDHNKKGKRKEISFLFELENGRSLKTELQCKFYNESETEHSKWGNKLTSIEYECQVSEGHTYVTVIKERYL